MKNNIFILIQKSSEEAKTSFLSNLEEMISNNYGSDSKGEFSDRHYVFLVGPDVEIPRVMPIGFYTQVMGIGRDRSKVNLKTVCMGNGKNALDTFWRGAENYSWLPMTSDEQREYGNYADDVFSPPIMYMGC